VTQFAELVLSVAEHHFGGAPAYGDPGVQVAIGRRQERWRLRRPCPRPHQPVGPDVFACRGRFCTFSGRSRQTVLISTPWPTWRGWSTKGSGMGRCFHAALSWLSPPSEKQQRLSEQTTRCPSTVTSPSLLPEGWRLSDRSRKLNPTDRPAPPADGKRTPSYSPAKRNSPWAVRASARGIKPLTLGSSAFNDQQPRQINRPGPREMALELGCR